MKPILRSLAPVLSLALVAACSSQEDSDTITEENTAVVTAPLDPAPTPSASASAAPTPAAAGPNTLTLAGLGDLRIGEPIPEGSSFASRGAQIPGSACKTVSSPDYDGVYAIVERGLVRRVSIGGNSDVKLAEGIGPGSTERAVLQAYPGFRSEPHKYVAAPAKYLTQPGSDPRLRFEIDSDGTVSIVHVGTMPQLGYVEGCA